MNVIQAVAGQSEERGALSMLYCATSDEVTGGLPAESLLRI